jgi:hypothetical protein
MKRKITDDIKKDFRDLIGWMLDINDVLDWVQANFEPDEVFDDDELETWAENADYVRPHDDYPEREL